MRGVADRMLIAYRQDEGTWAAEARLPHRRLGCPALRDRMAARPDVLSIRVEVPTVYPAPRIGLLNNEGAFA